MSRPDGTKPCRGKHCDARIRLARMVDGAWMPVDPDPVDDGELVWVKTSGEWRMRMLTNGETVPAGERRFRPHRATCPDAAVMRMREAFPGSQVIEPGAAALDAGPAAGTRPAGGGTVRLCGPRGSVTVQLPAPPEPPATSGPTVLPS